MGDTMGIHWNVFKGRRIPSCWDDCKTKEMKQLFIEHLEHIGKTEKCISFQDLTFKMYLKEISESQRIQLRKTRGSLTGQELFDFDRDINKKYRRLLNEQARMQRKLESQEKNSFEVNH